MSLYEKQHKNLVASFTDIINFTESRIESYKKELEERIEKLEFLKQQKQQLPADNPIIKKILPFLPYEINKIILDKLHIQKVIHKEETNLKFQMAYVMKELNYYYINNCMIRDITPLEYDIKKKRLIEDYWIGNFTEYKNARKNLTNLYGKYIEILENNYEKDFYEKEIIQSVENMNNLFNEWGEAQQPLMIELDKLTKQGIHNRYYKEITFADRTFKIFKSNSAINKKPLVLFLDYVKVYVETEINTILTNYGLEKIWLRINE